MTHAAPLSGEPAAEGEGLRARKRRAVDRSIRLAALRLVDERGLEHVTVEDIARAAGISPRTFFNYFDTKELSLVGPKISTDTFDEIFGPGDGSGGEGLMGAPTSAAGSLLEEFRAPIERYLERIDDREGQHAELVTLRRRVLHEYPELMTVHMTNVRSIAVSLTARVKARVLRRFPELSEHRATLLADLWTQVLLGAVRHAYTRWVESNGEADLVDTFNDTFTDLESLLALAASPRTAASPDAL